MFDLAAGSGEALYDVEDAIELGHADAVPAAIAAIDHGDTLHGLLVLDGIPSSNASWLAKSYLAYCVARERGQVQRALGMCRAAIAAQPDHPAHYLNLGRVLLLAGDKSLAIAAFWRGISRNAGPEGARAVEWPRHGSRPEHDMIMDELRRLGIRKPPPFPSLRRSHPLNKFTGLLLARMGLR